jgi:hypothetical protein
MLMYLFTIACAWKGRRQPNWRSSNVGAAEMVAARERQLARRVNFMVAEISSLRERQEMKDEE